MFHWWEPVNRETRPDVQGLNVDQTIHAEAEDFKPMSDFDLKKMKNLRKWKFRVKAEPYANQTLYVVGDCISLGNWMSSQAVALSLDNPNDNGEENTWSGDVDIPEDYDVHYRYFIGEDHFDDENNHSNKIIVRLCETHILPRFISKDVGSNLEKEFIDPEIFGLYGNITQIEHGWLTSETIIQLKFYNNPIEFWKNKLQNRKIYIKVTPITVPLAKHQHENVVLHDNGEESISFDATQDSCHKDDVTVTQVAVLNSEDNHLFKNQAQFGLPYNPGDCILFQLFVKKIKSLAILVDYYIYSSHATDNDPPFHFGFSYILSSAINNSVGQIIVPITNVRHRAIGQLTVEYLKILPIKDYECDMSVFYSRWWKHTWKGLEVGHRGLGNSFKMEMSECAEVRENTIASLKSAASHGADFVEFDVQLSKDLVPVIYHDFHVCIAMKRKTQLGEDDLLELPLKDLTLEQLQMLKVYHLSESRDKNFRSFNVNDDLEEHQPFPTLKHTFEAVDSHVGFNIEIKWTMQLRDGSYELYHPFDLNLYLDVVLKEVLKYGASRKIVFSCFHPDICTMIRMKQNKYPVIFLTQGVTSKWPEYNDPRTQTIPMAVKFALCAGILGINAHTEDILRDPSQVKLVKDAGLIFFCWGDDNNDRGTIKHLKDLGLHAIIYDKLDQYTLKEVKESIFLAEERQAKEEVLKVATVAATEVSDSVNCYDPNIIVKGGLAAKLESARENLNSISTATSLASTRSDYLALHYKCDEIKPKI